MTTEHRIIASVLIAHGLPAVLSESILATWDRQKYPNLVKYLERISTAIWDGSCDVIENAQRHPSSPRARATAQMGMLS